MVYVIADGGNNWSLNQIDNGDDGFGAAGNRFDPAIIFDANGTLYIMYGHRETNQTRLISGRSLDGGTTCTLPLVINDDSAVAALDSASYASPIIDNLGRLAVSWHDFNDTSIMISNSSGRADPIPAVSGQSKAASGVE